MTQNIYDDPGFFDGYARLLRSIDGLDGAPEWPAIRALLPRLAGLRIVDLGCGFGWFCRYAVEAGAASVLGLDVSENMLARARGETTDARVAYARADLDRVDLPVAAFEVAYSSLALHYVVDFARLIGAVHRALVPGGCFVFSIEHPIFMASRRPGWRTDATGARTWPVDDYLNEGPRTTEWLAATVIKQHRTLGTTLNLLIDAGFTIAHVEEWGPGDDQVLARPDLAPERERPLFLLVRATR